MLRYVQLFETPWTLAHQTSLCMALSRQEYWNGYPLPSTGDLPDPVTKPRFPALQADSLSSEPRGKPMTVSLCCVLVTQSNSLQPHGYSLPGSSVHGILQERILEWVAIPFSGGSSQLRDQTQICRAGRFFTLCATRKAQINTCCCCC